MNMRCVEPGCIRQRDEPKKLFKLIVRISWWLKRSEIKYAFVWVDFDDWSHVITLNDQHIIKRVLQKWTVVLCTVVGPELDCLLLFTWLIVTGGYQTIERVYRMHRKRKYKLMVFKQILVFTTMSIILPFAKYNGNDGGFINERIIKVC